MTNIEQMNGSLPPAPQINPARDPIALANATIRAVDQIGEAAAVEIEQSADELEASAHEVGDKLRRLAAAMREHTKSAGDDVEQFARQAIDAAALVRELKQRLDTGNGTSRARSDEKEA